ncbi:hypothetical protein OH76DRAFT_512162 [Lentinus brumalis]|uniref:Uncharacterized protein n=1 Tax=Lentinus brumalis TaxID=2498619 RepID=A0A371DB62_9APHY|nr:hypothetical protein OH76DRAFT_512162 [Polyporus brumalis]
MTTALAVSHNKVKPGDASSRHNEWSKNVEKVGCQCICRAPPSGCLSGAVYHGTAQGSSRKQNTYEVLLRHIPDDSEHLYPRRDFRRNITRHLVRGVDRFAHLTVRRTGRTPWQDTLVPEARQSPREQMSLESVSCDADRLSTTTLQLAGRGRGGILTSKDSASLGRAESIGAWYREAGSGCGNAERRCGSQYFLLLVWLRLAGAVRPNLRPSLVNRSSFAHAHH